MSLRFLPRQGRSSLNRTKLHFSLPAVVATFRDSKLAFLGFLIAVTHLLLVSYSNFVHAPVSDEIAHFAAGISHWDHGEFHLYSVNPPLPRILATAGLSLTGIERNWANYSTDVSNRSEFWCGRSLLISNPDSFPSYFFTLG